MVVFCFAIHWRIQELKLGAETPSLSTFVTSRLPFPVLFSLNPFSSFAPPLSVSHLLSSIPISLASFLSATVSLGTAIKVKGKGAYT